MRMRARLYSREMSSSVSHFLADITDSLFGFSFQRWGILLVCLAVPCGAAPCRPADDGGIIG